MKLWETASGAGSDERQAVSVRENFNARMAGMAPRSWFVALGGNLPAITADTEATKKKRQAALDQLRRLAKQVPESAELSQMLSEASHNFHK